jgi:hypothetical protein
MALHIHALRVSLAAGLLALTSAAPSIAERPNGPEWRTIERASRLLPRPPTVPVRLIDPELAADPEAIRRVDAFLVREPNGDLRQVIYLNRRSGVVENALAGKEIDIAILAAVIRHEQEHLRGATEREARRVEREFFQSLVFAGRVPLEEGLAYLHDLEQHHQLREG